MTRAVEFLMETRAEHLPQAARDASRLTQRQSARNSTRSRRRRSARRGAARAETLPEAANGASASGLFAALQPL